AAEMGREKRLGGTATFTVALHHLCIADAFLGGAVEIGIRVVAGFDTGIDAVLEEFGRRAQVGDAQRAAAAVPFVPDVGVVFRADEQRQHVLPAPADVAESGPVIVVGLVATDVYHGVDG